MFYPEELIYLKNLIKIGYERNIVANDTIAKPGLLTVGLIDLLQEVSVEYNTGDIVEIYASASTLKECDPESINKHIMVYAMPDDLWDVIEDYYVNNLNGGYVAGDDNLVIALSNMNQPLLGSF